MTTVHLCHLLKNGKLWHDTEKCFLSLYGFLSISYIKGCRNHNISKDVEKLRNCRYNLSVYSRLHVDAQVLVSHFRKIVELWCFACDSIVISEAHITFWMFVIVGHCNIIRTYYGETSERKLCHQKKWSAKIFWLRTFPSYHFSSLFSWTSLRLP